MKPDAKPIPIRLWAIPILVVTTVFSGSWAGATHASGSDYIAPKVSDPVDTRCPRLRLETQALTKGGPLTVSIQSTAVSFCEGPPETVSIFNLLPAGTNVVMTTGCQQDPHGDEVCTSFVDTTSTLDLELPAPGVYKHLACIVLAPPDYNPKLHCTCVSFRRPGIGSSICLPEDILNKLIFVDGFESADTSAWTLTVP